MHPTDDSPHIVNVIINGAPRDVASETTIAALLAELEVSQRHVAVEVNRQLVPRARHNEYQLREGDCLEVVTLVGGG